MTNYAKIAIAVVSIILICICMYLLLTELEVLPSARYNNSIFSDIEELNKLNAYAVADYEDPYIGDLFPIEHYSKQVEYEGDIYFVSAYMFDDQIDAMRLFYCNVWERPLDEDIINGVLDLALFPYSSRSESTIGHTKFATYYGTNAMVIESFTAKKKELIGFQNWVSETFTVAYPK